LAILLLACILKRLTLHCNIERLAKLDLHDGIAAETAARERFLAQLVQAPSDNPPGDCAAHA